MYHSLFGNGSGKKRTAEIKKHTVVTKSTSTPSPGPDPANLQRQAIKAVSRKFSRPSLGQHTQRNRLDQQRIRATQSRPSIDFGSEGSDNDEISAVPHKKIRRRVSNGSDLDRKFRCAESFQVHDPGVVHVLHAADIPSYDKMTKYEPALPSLPENHEIALQYPSQSQKERYKLIRPVHDRSAFDALKEIEQVMRIVSDHYLPDTSQDDFINESTGFPQRLRRASKKHSLEDITQVITGYNTALSQLLDNGAIASILDSTKRLHPKLVDFILDQTYSRTVSPNLKSLHMYEAGTDNVYGELLPRFVSHILNKDVRLRADQIFVDLGSGVGNVVLQAALEIGCESWGCEMMEQYCKVAVLQHDEFKARCRLWGLAIGHIHLESGDFLQSQTILKVLKTADMVLVNNQVFTPALNEGLTTLFLDLKDGCRIVSLKSFVPTDHKITARNLNSPYNILRVEERRYYSNSVSWTDQGGSYFISTKDSSAIEKVLAQKT